MKRRDFVKNAALTTLSAPFMLASLGAAAANTDGAASADADGVASEATADGPVTHLESEDVSPRALLDDDFPLHFLAIGDWGRNGEYDQLEVAQQMGHWAATHPNDFVISVGDNFYPRGVVSEMDPLWHYSFENIYTAHSLQCDWYPVLGNHDYGSDPDAQVRYSKVSRRWDMPSLYYSKEIPLGNGPDAGTALFVMIDTNPMLHEEQAAYVEKELVWIKDTLSKASANVKWKIVVGHHPYYTVGPRINNYDTLTIRKTMTQIFNDYKVDIYLSGHEHSLQHLQPVGVTQQFISGAGSELTPVTAGIPYSRFQASEHGFMYFSVAPGKVNVKAVNVDGTVLYETMLTR